MTWSPKGHKENGKGKGKNKASTDDGNGGARRATHDEGEQKADRQTEAREGTAERATSGGSGGSE